MTENFKIHPDKSRGQNFLTDKNVLQKIVAAAELKSSDTVVEIGAGAGVLTTELVKKAKRVITFEIDKKLIPILREKLKNFDNVEIRNENVLDFWQGARGRSLRGGPDGIGGDEAILSPIMRLLRFARNDRIADPSDNSKRIMSDIGFLNYKLVANIPYNITSAILEKFLSTEQPPELIVLLVQREVAERVCAKPGEMSILSVMTQYYGEPKIVARVPPSAFWPAPKVDSAILKIIVKKRWPAADEKKFWQIVKAGFSQRRKMLKNNLRVLNDEKKIAAAMRKAGIGEKARAQELGVEQWVDLAKKFDTHL